MIDNAAIKFQQLTKYPIIQYLDDSANFFKKSYPVIVNFFNGKINRVETKHIKEHKRLLDESNKLIAQFDNNAKKLETADFWILLDFCEDLRIKFQTLTKISKYLRSSRTDFNFSIGFAHPYVMGNEETMENISGGILRDSRADDDWVDIAMRNDLKEVQWDIDGGENITLYREKFVQNFVTSVIDNMVGEKIYGLDIQKKLEFFDDDLKILSYKDTVYQTVDILAGLRKGNIPEFNNMGVNQALYIGSNIANLAYSAISRELQRVFATDDLFINFRVKEIKLEQDSFFISFQVETKYKLLIESTTLVS